MLVFIGKSLILTGVIALVVTFVTYGGFFTLVLWWLGLMVVFKMDFWECRMLVFLLWGVNYVAGLILRGMMMSG